MPDSQTRNPVREHANAVMEDAEHVTVNENSVNSLAQELVSSHDFTMASWDAPVYPSVGAAPVEDVIDFIVVGNAINYAFHDLESGAHYHVTVNGQEWSGAYAMWAALHDQYSTSPDILDTTVLQGIDMSEVKRIFEPQQDSSLPLLESRVDQLNAVGELMGNVGGSFTDLFNEQVTLYGEDGIVERLVSSEAFRDDRTSAGNRIRFDKRAQLAVSMLYGKLLETSYEFGITDIGSFTVFADYGIPAGLRANGVLEYSESLSDAVDNQREIPENSPMEVEIRAATVVAGDRIQTRLQDEHGVPAPIPVLDFVLWQMRSGTDTQSHLTATTAY